jgi:hypothetical protein
VAEQQAPEAEGDHRRPEAGVIRGNEHPAERVRETGLAAGLQVRAAERHQQERPQRPDGQDHRLDQPRRQIADGHRLAAPPQDGEQQHRDGNHRGAVHQLQQHAREDPVAVGVRDGEVPRVAGDRFDEPAPGHVRDGREQEAGTHEDAGSPERAVPAGVSTAVRSPGTITVPFTLTSVVGLTS